MDFQRLKFKTHTRITFRTDLEIIVFFIFLVGKNLFCSFRILSLFLLLFFSFMNYYFICQVLSQRHFPKGIFPCGNFPNVHFPKRQLPKGQVRPSEAPQAAKGPRAAARMGQGSERCGQKSLGGRSLRLGQTREVAT